MKLQVFLPALILGLVLGITGEIVLFFQGQCEKIEQALKEDFRVSLILKKDTSAAQAQILGDQLSALAGISEVHFVGPDEVLSNLKRQDPELSDSVSLVGQNPLSSSYELRLDDAGIERLSSLISEIETLTEWDNVLYKPQEAQAVLQVQFYRRLSVIALEVVGCIVIGLALWALWGRDAQRESLLNAHAVTLIGGSVLGAFCGELLIIALAFPLKRLNPWWVWPPFWIQSGLAAVSALLAWSLHELRMNLGFLVLN